MKVADDLNLVVFMIPTVLALLMMFRRSHTRHALLALHVWAVVITAALYFGDARFRVPYDGVIIVLVVELYARVARRLRTAVTRWLRDYNGPRLAQPTTES